MQSEFYAACLQLNTKINPEENFAVIYELACKACEQEADFIFLPENAPYFLSGDLHAAKEIVVKWQLRSLNFFTDLAGEKKIWLSVTMASLDNEARRLSNRTYLINREGHIVTTYDKIHLFNVDLGDNEIHSESKIFEPGHRVVIAETPWGKMGFAICYDMRFPYLFQIMRKQGVDFFSVPSSFTALTGKAHWHALLRARAIENSCYLFAPNQSGIKQSGQTTYGHSLIVSPWGEVLGDCEEENGFVLASIKRKEIEKARALIPASSSTVPASVMEFFAERKMQ